MKTRIIFGLLALSLFAAGCAPSQVAVQPSATSTQPSKAECLEFTDLSIALTSPSGVCVLTVSGKGLTGALPAEIRHFSKIQRLDASKNQMTGIPAEIGQLSTLRELDYSSNKLDTMPDEIANLKNLESLSLAKNFYRSVPASVLKLTQLRVLDLTGNPLSVAEVARAKKALPNTDVKF